MKERTKTIAIATYAILSIVALVILAVRSFGHARIDENELAGAGYNGTSIFGCQNTGRRSSGCEWQIDPASTPIPAGGCVDYVPMTPMLPGEIAVNWGAALFEYDKIDSGLPCDGGQCSAFITSLLPADLHGGQLCQAGGGVCAGTDGGGIDQQQTSFPAGGQTAFGGTEHLVWNAPTSQVALQICCGSQACRAQGSISGRRLIPLVIVDAGVTDSGPVDSGADSSDAADAADAADSAPVDSGPPPNPMVCCASGGNPVAAWWSGAGGSFNHSGSTLTSATDLSGNGQTITATASPTYNASGSTPTPQPTFSLLASSTQYLSKTGFGPDAGANQAFNTCVVAKPTVSGNMGLISWANSLSFSQTIEWIGTTTPLFTSTANTAANWTGAVTGSWNVFCAGTTGVVTSGNSFIDINHAGAQTSTWSSGGIANSGTGGLFVGATNGGGLPITAEIADAIVCAGTTTLSPTTVACIQTWENYTYGLTGNSDGGTIDAGGSDSGSDSGGVDGGVNAPTISLVTPNLGGANGGWSIKLTGTNFRSGATASINAVNCASTTVNSATSITCVTPAYSTANGSTSAQTVKVTNSDATFGSGSGIPASYYYLPTNTPIVMAHRADVGVTVATGVSNWADYSPAGIAWAQATGGSQPAAPTGNFSGSGLPYIACDGTTSYMQTTIAAATPAVTVFHVFSATIASLTGANVGTSMRLGAHAGGTMIYSQFTGAGFGYQYETGNGSANGLFSSAFDGNPHVYEWDNGGSFMKVSQDGTSTTTTVSSTGITTNSGVTDNQLCGITASTQLMPAHILGDVVYGSSLSSGDYTTAVSVLRTTSGI